ncbi:hypothetical protein K488DRAFT_46262 [Vararia minispora EC-137]|uniref:Uncharacterized protein n=1 Tax=Vararia minispora EC-137 TaxID=1314806 RepID=A0ACB8QQY0_9AGAM|nr:hypothetical protein K488DRAFT_46262 [Vararia minispora EC-137]
MSGFSSCDREIDRVAESLPRLTEDDLRRLGHHDSACPICMNTHLASLAEEEHAQVMDSPAHALEDLGVTRLSQTCGHLFCRKDLLTWVRDGHPSCPMCRAPFIRASDDTSGQSASTTVAQDVDVEFDAALGRILAAYQEERERIHAAPTYHLFGFPQPQEFHYGSAEYDNDRSEFSGMYS